MAGSSVGGGASLLTGLGSVGSSVQCAWPVTFWPLNQYGSSIPLQPISLVNLSKFKANLKKIATKLITTEKKSYYMYKCYIKNIHFYILRKIDFFGVKYCVFIEKSRKSGKNVIMKLDKWALIYSVLKWKGWICTTNL